MFKSNQNNCSYHRFKLFNSITSLTLAYGLIASILVTFRCDLFLGDRLEGLKSMNSDASSSELALHFVAEAVFYLVLADDELEDDLFLDIFRS